MCVENIIQIFVCDVTRDQANKIELLEVLVQNVFRRQLPHDLRTQLLDCDLMAKTKTFGQSANMFGKKNLY